MPGPRFAVGERVSLHPIEDEDHEFVQYGRNHPEVRASLFTNDVETSDDVAEMLDDSDDRLLLCRTDGDDPEPVGVIGFAWVWSSGQVGNLMYWIAPEHQENGYVTEATELFLDYAFRERGFHRICAEVAASNAASAAVLEKLGFEREGVHRKQNFVDGEWRDSYAYGLLADEWLED